MKKNTILFLMICLVVCLFPLGMSAGVKLDVKTQFTEKYELKGVKYGVIYFLKREGYEVVEVGEKYAVWLRDVKESREKPDKYTISMTVSISKPSLFRQKKALATDTVTVKYSFHSKSFNVDDTGFVDFVKAKVKNITAKEKIRAFFVSREVAKKVKFLLNRLSKPQVEKMI